MVWTRSIFPVRLCDLCDNEVMQILTFDDVARRLAALGVPEPRIVMSGNFATPVTLNLALTKALGRCRLFQLNAQPTVADQPGFICETPFVGPGVRHNPMLDYLPMRLSLVPRPLHLGTPRRRRTAPHFVAVAGEGVTRD